jgi:subtilisin family serine protease
VGVQTVLINPSSVIVRSNGTSFATPMLAGLAASLWSALPDKNAMQIRDLIIRSANHYTSPDPNHQYGYGIPDAWEAYRMGSEEEMDIEQIREKEPARKFIRGDQILIFRHGHIYNLAGQRVQ